MFARLQNIIHRKKRKFYNNFLKDTAEWLEEERKTEFQEAKENSTESTDYVQGRMDAFEKIREILLIALEEGNRNECLLDFTGRGKVSCQDNAYSGDYRKS